MENDVTTMNPQTAGSNFLFPTTKVSELVPINIERALAAMPEEDRNQVMALAEAIDITKMENIFIKQKEMQIQHQIQH